MTKRSGSALVALAALMVSAVSATGAAGAGVPGTISISPSRTAGKALARKTYGPITLTNSTDKPLAVRVVPSLLRQDLTGAIFVDQSAAARARAAALIQPQVRSFVLAPGGTARSVLALLRRVPGSGSVYGGLLFQSQPQGKVKAQQIQQVFRINGSLYLDPTARRAHVRFGGQPMHAEQAAPRVLSLITPIVNRGNWALKVSGEIRVLDSSGRLRYRQAEKSIDVVLPTAVVELRRRMAQPVLAPGVYQLRGSWRTSHGERFRTSGTMRLFAPNAVATRGAKLTDVSTGPAYYGDPVSVRTKFRNTGNVAFAPTALVTVRRLGKGSHAVFAQTRVTPSRAAAGTAGSFGVNVHTPPGKEAFEVGVQVFDGKRLLDSRTLSLLPQKKPSLWKRTTAWITDHALLLVALLVLLVVVLLVYALAARRRRRDDGPRSIPAVAAPLPRDPVTPVRVATAPAPAPAAENGLVDLNTAGLDELMRLPGLGRRAGERVIAHREANGAFRSLEDLHAVEGFHQERIHRIAEHVKL
jgi:competence ComEA-like helix-hairpin-helix protein